MLSILFIPLMSGRATAQSPTTVTYDLSADWSDTSNPNGPWSYNAGNHPITSHLAAWAPHFFDYPQPAWVVEPSGPGHIPAWAQGLPGVEAHYSQAEAGDVVVHAHDNANGLPSDDPANVTWTSPVDFYGNATIEGAVWRVFPEINRATNWTLSVDGLVLASGSLDPSDPGDRPTLPGDPRLFSVDVPVQAGDIVKMEFHRTSLYGDMIGVRLNISGTLIPPDEPPVADAGPDFSVDEGQAFVTLDGTGSNDPDGDPLQYSWSQSAGTSVALSDAASAQPSFTAPLVGIGGETLSFELSVTANGESSTDEVNVFVENRNEPPAVSITAPADGTITGATSIVVSADVTDEDATTITSTPPGIAPGTLAAGGGAATGSLALAAEGPNDLIVSALDAGGLSSATSVVVYRDTISPVVTISPAEGTIVSSPIPSFAITVNDQTQTDVSVDGAGAGTATVPGGDLYGVSSAVLTGSIPLWSEGANSIVVSATDAAGNTTTVTRTVFLDSTAPLIAIASPVNGACYGIGSSVEIPLSATIDDATATEVSGALSASLPAGGGTAVGTYMLVEGVNDITVFAQDNAGTGLVAADTVSVTLDTTAPTVAITSPGDLDCVSGMIEFHATASDALPGSIASTTFFVDAVALEPTSLYSVDTTTLSDGPHQLSVEATDSCGNVSTAAITIHVDNTPPTVTISNPLDLELVSGTIAFDAVADDGGSGLASITMSAANLPPTVDGSQSFPAPVGSAWASSQVDTFAALGGQDGLLELDVTAVDCAGNATTVAITVDVDNTAPGKAILMPADGAAVRCSIRIAADAGDPNLDTVQFVVDGVAQPILTSAPYEMIYDTRSRLDGDLPITLIATDLAGNVSTCTIHVTVDNLRVRILPRFLRLKSRWGSHWVLARIDGQSAGLLTGLDPSDITLCVPGGSPIPASLVFGCSSERRWVKFDRKLLIGALRGAGITGGRVELSVKATVDGRAFDLGSTRIRVR